MRAMRGPRSGFVAGWNEVGALICGAGCGGGGSVWSAVGVARAYFRRLRRLPPSRTIRPYSATRATLVFTPFCISNSAMMA